MFVLCFLCPRKPKAHQHQLPLRLVLRLLLPLPRPRPRSLPCPAAGGPTTSARSRNCSRLKPPTRRSFGQASSPWRANPALCPGTADQGLVARLPKAEGKGTAFGPSRPRGASGAGPKPGGHRSTRVAWSPGCQRDCLPSCPRCKRRRPESGRQAISAASRTARLLGVS